MIPLFFDHITCVCGLPLFLFYHKRKDIFLMTDSLATWINICSWVIIFYLFINYSLMYLNAAFSSSLVIISSFIQCKVYADFIVTISSSICVIICCCCSFSSGAFSISCLGVTAATYFFINIKGFSSGTFFLLMLLTSAILCIYIFFCCHFAHLAGVGIV